MGFQCLDHPPYSGSDPVGLPPVTWTEKTIEREVGRAKDISANRYLIFPSLWNQCQGQSQSRESTTVVKGVFPSCLCCF
jgi:hypothetical protein